MHQKRNYLDDLQGQIKTHIKEKKSSVKALERQAGLKEASVKNILSGRSSNPGIEVVIALAEALDCSVDELIGRSASRSSNVDNIVEDHKTKIPLTWNADLYQDCVREVEKYIQNQSFNPSDEQILYFIKEAYTYSTQADNNKADLRFIKWLIDGHQTS